MGRSLVAYLKLVRFPFVFTAIADSVAGYFLGLPDEPRPLVVGLLSLSSACLYFFGMALNDVGDRERDRDLHPERVIPSGRVSLRGAGIFCALLLLISLGAALAIPSTAYRRMWFWGWLVGSILIYDLVVKRPIVMGMARACNLGIGLAAASDVDSGSGEFPVPIIVALVPLLYVTSLTFVSTLEEGVFKRWKVLAGATGMGLGVVLSATWIPYLAVHGRMEDLGKALGAAGPAWAAAGVLLLWIARRAAGAVNRKGVMLLVRDGVGGILLLDAAMLLSAQRTVTGAIVAAMVVPAALSVALFRRLP